MLKVGKDSHFKRLKTEDGLYGYAKMDSNEIHLDVGKTLKVEDLRIVREAIKRCDVLNARSWYVAEPVKNIVAGRPDAITPRGDYPVYASRHCVSQKYDEILREEFAWLQKRYDWDVYHDSEGKGQFASGQDRAHNDSSKTNVRTLYGMAECDVGSLPVQNPCGLPSDMQWSKNCLCEPFVPMPPATRHYRDLVSLGNPSVTRIFQKVVGMKPYYLGCAAYVVRVCVRDSNISHSTSTGTRTIVTTQTSVVHSLGISTKRWVLKPCVSPSHLRTSNMD